MTSDRLRVLRHYHEGGRKYACREPLSNEEKCAEAECQGYDIFGEFLEAFTEVSYRDFLGRGHGTVAS